MTALEILKEFNKILPLENLIYEVRDNEGLGWDGPLVIKWSDCCVEMKKLLKEKE